MSDHFGYKCDDCNERWATSLYLRKDKKGRTTQSIRLKLCGYCRRKRERLGTDKQKEEV